MANPISIWDDPYHMSVDPLLGSDSFIAAESEGVADGNQTEATEQINVPSQQQDEKKPSSPQTKPDPIHRSSTSIGGGDKGIATDVQPDEPVYGSDPLLGSDAFIAADTVGEGDASHTPVGGSFEGTPARRSRKGTEDAEKRPNWLPENWEMILKTRSSGATAGTTDRYYVEPSSRQRFRSKIEVFRYLETGSKKKPNSDANATPSDTPGKDKDKSGTKSKKSGTKRKKEAPWTFDFQNPPEEVSWSLVDENQGLWKPSIADEEVPEKSAVEWTTTFKRVCETP